MSWGATQGTINWVPTMEEFFMMESYFDTFSAKLSKNFKIMKQEKGTDLDQLNFITNWNCSSSVKTLELSLIRLR